MPAKKIMLEIKKRTISLYTISTFSALPGGKNTSQGVIPVLLKLALP